MVKLISLTLCLLFSEIGQGQLNISPLKMEIQNNIISYHIFALAQSSYEPNDEQLLLDNFKGGRFDNLMRGQKLELIMNFMPSEFTKFPDSNYLLFELSINNFYFVDSNTMNSILLSTPLPYDEKYLVAINKVTSEIIYISGNFFINYIIDFFPQPLTKESISNFLYLKLFNQNLTEISSIKNRNKSWIVECKLQSNSIKVVIPKKNPDKLKIYY